MFFQESFSSSVDFPTYIPWQTLSSDLSDKLKHGSIRINRSNRVEYATIQEEGTPLLENGTRKGHEAITDGSIVTEAVRAGTSWPVAAFLLVNAALGAGVLNYPYAYDKAGGVVFAAFLQIIMMVVLIATMLVLVYSADVNKDTTYHDVLNSLCGRRAQQFAALSILLTCYGICITFLIIIGDQYDRLFMSVFAQEFCTTWYLDRRFTIAVTAVLCILPMCYFQRLDFLRYASTLGIFAMLYPVFLTVYEYYKLDVVPGKIKVMPDSAVQVFVVIPVFSFAYQTHEIVVPVYACMKNRNLRDFTKATF
ncbi:putative sodium-coupled neutral amino acid transporter 7 [Caerostris extrusa]|uniref:Sodium-coupled neutral amino acid transporter 7 n=1 Tax=Caerostris extrusa TaxID=172846 RepID=A0AAV4T3R6_CAEEX|nr:putative sodium-coupled neutral amino acid transporter 7 [Caerostris extrusa]